MLAILELLRYHQRVLYIDIDIHHGDGVEEAFYTTDRVMTCSFHKFGEYFPGTGDLRDIGHGKGKHYAVNFPLRDGIDDQSYKSVFEPTIQAIMDMYRPGAVVLQCGADSLAGDRLGCFNLSMRGHAQCVEFVKKFNIPMVVLGGGGYTIRNVARAWAYETALTVDQKLADDLPFNDYFEYYGPDFVLDVPANNMDNLNTREYLERTKAVILENLRHIPHAPSVQMSAIPRDGYEETVKDLMDDESKDPDQRSSLAELDARRARELEYYEDSEDEDNADTSGGRVQKSGDYRIGDGGTSHSLLTDFSGSAMKSHSLIPKSPVSHSIMAPQSPTAMAGVSVDDQMDVDEEELEYGDVEEEEED